MHIMLDIETMGVTENTPILSIGAVAFTAKEVRLGVFYDTITLESCIEAGMQPDASTILWWMQQSEEARSHIAPNSINDRRKNIKEVLTNFKHLFIKSLLYTHNTLYKDLRVWGNGADFDNRILTSAYKNILGEEAPWPYRGNRCFRTIANLYDRDKTPRTGTAHNALDDAQWQVEHLMATLKHRGISLDEF